MRHRYTCDNNCSNCTDWDCDIECGECECIDGCISFSNYWDKIYASGDEEKIDSLFNGKWKDGYRGGNI